MKGTKEILDSLQKTYSLKAGETTTDNKLSLMTARCIGACGLAPAVVFDGVVAGVIPPA